MFPAIETIDDVLPHIQGNIGFFVTRFDDYDVIDYGFVIDETFTSQMALECRGLKFGKDGRLLARPFHKFFNLGERERPESIDWTAPHVVLAKLDGSMVHPCMVKGELTFMTRMGVTPQSKAALSIADDSVLRLSKYGLDAGMTVLFEFTSPDNRIVIGYDKPGLTLLAVRDNRTGRYLQHAELLALADRFGVPLIESLPPSGDTGRFATAARDESGIEGYVIVFDNGHRLKLKTAYYALRHKALSGLALEKNVLGWVADDAVDDVVPLLAPTLADRLRDYQQTVVRGVNTHLEQVAAFVDRHRMLGRREFAQAAQGRLDKRLQPVAFALLDGKDGRDVLKKQLLWASHSEGRLDSIRDLYNMSWDVGDSIVEAG